MLKRLNAWRQRQYFHPSLLGIFVNPVFIIRRGLYRAIAKYAPVLTGRVLDFGAGSAPYRPLFRGASDYVTLDIEQSGHDQNTKVADYFYDGRTLPFPDESFDSAFSSEVFEHIFNLPEVLLELRRILRPGGRLLVTAPFVWEEHEIPYDFARYTSFGLSHLLVQAGFIVVAQEKTTGYIATLFQMLAVYFLQRRILRSGVLRAIAIMMLAAPICILGLFLDAIFPSDDRLYHNQVLLCRKT